MIKINGESVKLLQEINRSDDFGMIEEYCADFPVRVQHLHDGDSGLISIILLAQPYTTHLTGSAFSIKESI